MALATAPTWDSVICPIDRKGPLVAGTYSLESLDEAGLRKGPGKACIAHKHGASDPESALISRDRFLCCESVSLESVCLRV